MKKCKSNKCCKSSNTCNTSNYNKSLGDMFLSLIMPVLSKKINKSNKYNLPFKYCCKAIRIAYEKGMIELVPEGIYWKSVSPSEKLNVVNNCIFCGREIKKNE